MKYLFSLTYYSPYVSGISIYVKRLAEALVQRGHKCSVLCFQHVSDLSTNETIGSVRVRRVKPLFSISKGFFAISWIFESWQEIRQHNVVFINLPQPEGIIVALFARLQHKKLVSIYHCDVYLPKGVFNKIAEVVTKISSHICLILSQQVVGYTRDYAVHSPILKYYLTKTTYTYPPFTVPTLHKRSQNRKSNEFTLGIASRLSSEKGIEYLLGAIADIDCRLLIAGPQDPAGENKYKNKIYQQVKLVNKKVEFLGTIKPEDMQSFYDKLDCLVLPSINSTESFGMVQVEAMYAGIPVIATDLPGVKVPIQITKAGIIVRPRSVNELIEAIVEIQKNRKRYLPDPKTIAKIFDIKSTINFYEAF